MAKLTLYPATNNVSLVSAQDVADAQSYAKNQLMRLDNNTINARDNTMRHYMSSTKIYGEPPLSATMNPQFGAAINADPAAVWFWNIIVNGANATAALSQQVQLEIDMIQYVEFSQRTVLES